jgi:hypothetical protein
MVNTPCHTRRLCSGPGSSNTSPLANHRTQHIAMARLGYTDSPIEPHVTVLQCLGVLLNYNTPKKLRLSKRHENTVQAIREALTV